jgi:hypothetical protein
MLVAYARGFTDCYQESKTTKNTLLSGEESSGWAEYQRWETANRTLQYTESFLQKLLWQHLITLETIFLYLVKWGRGLYFTTAPTNVLKGQSNEIFTSVFFTDGLLPSPLLGM